MSVRQQHAAALLVHAATVVRIRAVRSPENYGPDGRKLRDEAVFDGEMDQAGTVLDAKRLHHAVLVILYGAR